MSSRNFSEGSGKSRVGRLEEGKEDVAHVVVDMEGLMGVGVHHGLSGTPNAGVVASEPVASLDRLPEILAPSWGVVWASRATLVAAMVVLALGSSNAEGDAEGSPTAWSMEAMQGSFRGSASSSGGGCSGQ